MGAPLYVSRPAVTLPSERVDNDETLRRVRARYRGSEKDWAGLEEAIRYVFARCHTRVRYLEPDPEASAGEYASRAVRACLEAQGWRGRDVQLLVYGGIARNYFEPATAMEVAARSGMQQVHAFDVTSACVGMLEALHVVAAHFALHPELQRAVVCAAELSPGRLDYDLQQPSDLLRKAAGLTIGNAAAAMAVAREPFDRGCMQVLDMTHRCLPQHYDLCKVPIQGQFDSLALELQKLAVHVPPQIKQVLARVNWSVSDVDYFVSHQPGDAMVIDTLAPLGIELHRMVLTHQYYANTASTTVPLALHHLAERGLLMPDDKLVFCSIAAGLSIVAGAGLWIE